MDAVFKRAKAAYDNDPGPSIKAALKGINKTANDLHGEFETMLFSYREALDKYDKMTKHFTWKGMTIRKPDDCTGSVDNLTNKFRGSVRDYFEKVQQQK